VARQEVSSRRGSKRAGHPTNHGTRVRIELGAELRGLKKPTAPMVQKTMNAEVGHFDRLKQLLEG
jgi:hypothetical protein